MNKEEFIIELEKINIRLNEEQLNKLFELASMSKKLKARQIASNDISQALIEIERKLYCFSAEVKVDSLENKKILIDFNEPTKIIFQLISIIFGVNLEIIYLENKENNAIAEQVYKYEYSKLSKEDNNKISLYCMFIMKYDEFEKYCEWLFSVLSAV